jgi:Domain of unknown function DUF29
MRSPSKVPAYEDDLVAWLEDQAWHARRGEIDALDLENIAEELEGIARSDRREVRNRLEVLLTHLLKRWIRPEKHSASWLGTIFEQSGHITQLIEDSPSLRSFPAHILDPGYPEGRRKAALQMRLRERVFPETCPFAIEDILQIGWLPFNRAP